jgi:hypothetical protein
MVFPGYNEPHIAKYGFWAGKEYQIGVDDEARWVTMEEHARRVEAVAHNETYEIVDANSKTKHINAEAWYGILGECPFLKVLPHLRHDTFPRVPVYHCLLLGIVKDFWVAVFRWAPKNKVQENPIEALAITTKEKKQIDAALKGMTLTADFNRSFKTGIAGLGGWVCEDWKRFMEVFSVFLQEERVTGATLPDLTKEMWGHLRRGAMHYFSQDPTSYQEARRNGAASHLEKYSKLVELHAPQLLSYNLHLARCRLAAQEKQLGLVGNMGELWGERGLRPFKAITRNKAPVDCEKVLCNALLAKAALFRFMAEHGGEAGPMWSAMTREEEEGTDLEEVSSSSEMQAEIESTSALPELHDSAAAATSSFDDVKAKCGLLGKGEPPTPAQLDAIERAIDQLINDGMLEEGDAPIGVLGKREIMGSPWVHTRAFIHHKWTIYSSAYKKTRSRDTRMLQVTYEEKQWVCRANFFARIHLVNGKVMRIAVADFFPEPEEIDDSRFGRMLYTKDRVTHENDYPVILDTVERPLAYLRCQKGSNEDELYFVQYQFSSKM